MTYSDNIWVELIRMWRAGDIATHEFLRLTNRQGNGDDLAARRREVRELVERHRQIADLEKLL